MPVWLKKIIIGISWIGIWELVYILLNQKILFVSPMAVGLHLIQLFQQPIFYQVVIHSLITILVGFLLSLIIGSLLAVAAFIYPLFDAFITPFIGVMKATPVASFVVLALVFMKSVYLPILVSFLMVMPLIFGNILEGLNAVDEQLVEMSQVFHVPFYKQLRTIYLPTVIPYFLAAFQTGIGYAWKSGITAEVMVSPMGSIGRYIADAKVYFDTLELFAWTTVVILLSLIIEKIAVTLFKWICNKYHLLPKSDTLLVESERISSKEMISSDPM